MAAPWVSPVTLLRIAIILGVLAAWELLAQFRLAFIRDVVPSLMAIGRALAELLMSRDYYFHLTSPPPRSATRSPLAARSGSPSASCSAPIASCRRRSNPISIISGRRPRSSSSDHDHVVRGRPRIQDRARHAVCFFPVALNVAAACGRSTRC